MQITSATVVTIVSIVGAAAQALQASGQPELAVAGMVLAGLYTICHSIVQVKQAQAAANPAPTEAHDSASAPGYKPPTSAQETAKVVVEAKVATPAPTPAPEAPKAP